MNDILSSINKEGNLDFVFNAPKRHHKQGVYKRKSWCRLNGAWNTQQKKGAKNIPMQVMLNLDAGTSKVEKLNFGKKLVNCLHVFDYQVLGKLWRACHESNAFRKANGLTHQL